jgi:cobalt-zinc-cadmium efflux system outer membrane protein
MAEDSGGLSLPEALEIAYAQNPRMAAVRQEAEAAKGRWIQAGVYPNPEVEVSVTELSKGVGSGSTVGDDSVALSQEIDLLGKVPLKAKVAQAEYQAIRHTLEQTWNEVAFELTRAYNTLLLSTQRVGVAREVLELTRRLLDRVQLKYNAGEALRNELLRAQIEAAQAENAVLEVEKQVSLDAAQLNILLGRDARAPLVATDELTYEPRELDPDALIVQALARRPDLKARKAALQAQHEQVRLARRNIVENPAVSAIGTRERGDAGTEQVFGMAVRWPLPFWNRNQGTIREAQAELQRRTVEQEALTRQVGLEVISAVAEARLAQRQVAVLRAAVDQANELMRLATLQYSEGEINFVTYLEHLAAVRETKVNFIQALASYRTQLALVNQTVSAAVVPSAAQEESR